MIDTTIGQNLVGRKIGPYYIEGIVGQGSTAYVYRALDANDKLVALKVFILFAEANHELLLSLFESEANAAGHLEHPNIVPVLDAGQQGWLVYIAMPFVKGEPLEAHLRRKKRLNETSAVDIAQQIAGALHYIHQQGVLHRDVKPSNILLTADGQAFLTDFSAAFIFDKPGAKVPSGRLVGTPAYMAPEQALVDESLDGRADLYSLGVVLYRMLTGQFPIPLGSSPEMLEAHIHKTPPTPSTIARVSPELDAVVMKAIAKDRTQRFQNGQAMAQELLKIKESLDTQKRSLWQLATEWLAR